jgi:outer membrane protein TolC
VDCEESFVTASDRLRQLLDLDEPVLFLPGGFLSIMEAPQVDLDDAQLVLDNPDYRSAVIKVKSAELVRDLSNNRILPDLRLSAGFESTQFNSKYGFDNPGQSVNWVFSNPDSKSFSAGIAYQRFLRNRAAEAALAISERDLEARGLDLRDIENELDRDFRNARIRLGSALEQVKITQRNGELAQSVYDRAVRFQQLRKVTEFEIVQNLRDLLTAKNRHVDARIELRYAEAALLNSAGLLAERFGERTSQTDYDRERLKVLAQSGILKHFGKVQ